MAKAPFDLTNHAMLSARCKALEEAELDAHTRMAEYLLGLQTATFSSTYEEQVKVALAVQVNFQVEQGSDGQVYREMHDGETWEVYQDRTTDPRALQMAARLLTQTTSSTYQSVPSLR